MPKKTKPNTTAVAKTATDTNATKVSITEPGGKGVDTGEPAVGEPAVAEPVKEQPKAQSPASHIVKREVGRGRNKRKVDWDTQIDGPVIHIDPTPANTRLKKKK